MYLWLDKTNKQIVEINNTKASDKLLEIKKDDETFSHLFTVHSRVSRRDVQINYSQFDIPEKNQTILTAKEYLDAYSLN